jgi:type II secretory ATPase GspE/PulE/Tfp pilus assembly ATPase PilB-like protein
MSPAIERMTNAGAHRDQIQQVAIAENGMRLMRDDGFEKVRNHLTTIEEVLRVTAE